jgi:hypothetical protein
MYKDKMYKGIIHFIYKGIIHLTNKVENDIIPDWKG